MGNYHQKRGRVNYHYFVVIENGYATHWPVRVEALPSATAKSTAASTLGRCDRGTTVLVLDLLVSPPLGLIPTGGWEGAPLHRSPPVPPVCVPPSSAPPYFSYSCGP